LVDREGIPLAIQLTAANVNDTTMLEQTADVSVASLPTVDARAPLRRFVGLSKRVAEPVSPWIPQSCADS
jgi:hypothetical protein